MKICLNMIVKNEAVRIERCLGSVLPWISTFAIVDTGSSDNTVQKVNDFLYGAGKNGLTIEKPFVDFSTSRNHALELARTTECDYILLVDADMELIVENKGWLDNLEFDAYRMTQKSGNLSYRNTRLLRRDTPSRYMGVTHEYLDLTGITASLDGAWFVDHADGANRPGKFQRDIDLLEADLQRNPGNHRSVFYLAQSYKDLGNCAKAAELYEKRAEMGGWDEEVFYSWLGASRAMRTFG